MWHTCRLYFILSARKRADYLRKNKIFKNIGKNCTIMERKVPLYSKLISIGDNVHLASKVLLVTHDIVHLCLNNMGNNGGVREKIGCIDIGNNVFVGSNTTILYDVKIGNNVIIGAGSLVCKDITDNVVVAGVPAKIVGRFDDFVNIRINEKMYPDYFKIRGHEINIDLENWCWEDFYKKRKNNE